MSPTVNGQYFDPDAIGEGDLTKEQEVYRANILDHYRNPRNKKELDEHTHTATEKNPFCGDELTVQLVVEKDVVKQIAFEGTGCAISQSTMSMLTKKLVGRSPEDIYGLGQPFILELLNIPIGIVRRKCAMLGLRVIQKALVTK